MIALLLVLGLGSIGTALAGGVPSVYKRASDKPFATVVSDLEFAITDRNFSIVGRNQIGRGIRAMGEAAPEAVVIQFCNLSVAHEAFSIALDLIVYMPCRISVYEDGHRVSVSALLMPEDSSDARANAFASKVNRQLRQMINYAAR